MQCLAATGDYLRALSRQDRSAAIGVASRALETQTSVAEVIEQMLVPAQVEVGIRAQHDDWGIAEEHAATAITEVVLGMLALAVVATGGDPGHAPARGLYEAAGFPALPLVRYYRTITTPENRPTDPAD